MIRNLSVLLAVVVVTILIAAPTPNAEASCVDAWGTPCSPPPATPTPSSCGPVGAEGECTPGFTTAAPWSCTGLPGLPLSIWGGMFGGWMLVVGIMGYLGWQVWRPKRRRGLTVNLMRQRLELEAKERTKAAIAREADLSE